MDYRMKSSDALKYIWKSWVLTGVYPVDKYNLLQTIHAGFILICLNISWILSLCINLFFMDSFEHFLDNLPMNVTAIVCLVKFVVTLKMHRNLKDISNLIDELDSHISNARQKDHIKTLIKFCHRLFKMFVGCYLAAGTMDAIGAGLSKGEHLLHETWFPFDWRASTFNYSVAFTYQYAMMTFLGLQIAIFDVCVPTYLIFLTAHLEFLMERIENINRSEPPLSQEENYQELVACIKDFRNIVRIFNTLQDTIAYVVFVQFSVTSLVIVTLAVNYLVYHLNAAQIAYKVLFVSATIIQILPCCYYSNQFSVVSDRFVTSLYSCNWFDLSTKFKRTMMIFMQMTQKRLILIAGKVVPVTLDTFVSIMKMTYSLITFILNFQK